MSIASSRLEARMTTNAGPKISSLTKKITDESDLLSVQIRGIFKATIDFQFLDTLNKLWEPRLGVPNKNRWKDVIEKPQYKYAIQRSLPTDIAMQRCPAAAYMLPRPVTPHKADGFDLWVITYRVDSANTTMDDVEHTGRKA
ncbi:hypothetical protein C0992_012071 [Termitomyces sp. T32_za158]|nr:hypothetical protein C0992_012071 [Termitomyces sp. T32_za158]